MHSCPICKSGDTFNIFVKENIDYLKCQSCFFVFSKPAVNVNFQENIEDFEDVYVQYFDANATDQKNFKLLFNWVEKSINLSKSKIVYIGCGSGKFVNYLLEKKIDSYGIEPSKPLYNKYLKENTKFYNSTIEDFSKSSNIKFDVITLLDVLEHVEYPSIFIDHIIQLQAPEGYLIIEIPLYGSLLSKISGKNWHFFNKYHLSYFTKSRLISLLNEKGYELVLSTHRGKYFDISYFINYIYYFIFRKQDLNIPRFLRNRSIYLNTYDILLASFKKKS
jgi:2-polyprenyl-3-methyl-5-hydroxy-6-metoxy-1,4-benzoquinol methylase